MLNNTQARIKNVTHTKTFQLTDDNSLPVTMITYAPFVILEVLYLCVIGAIIYFQKQIYPLTIRLEHQ